ncbi:FliI/YscN family ATPase [Sulfitobacter sp. M57]|uniref:FliI/YscN family ATPase n=1 Tax=unclassified Sulfitobacter TaxID=196795 RepID=UPI0023E311F0|nr:MULTISPECIES: FliI/YscN family ATPase [unclassified Sulfitobacter]MDF3415197.1 FliI/YscN family ATPase [Sulfitobacter sp. KE5]MDF3422678.1 FliI/YscN family ATPase [Sulfitobacter sp. KE43]MDF3433743.1 FliI/YscN family ATPase [Sulfitobacter sp. KE42]MDF3459383.1 FliI/YscN family ATPase [Sulfitobacter sp. S74]MDF3463282.1 FliI/YscN family ATPase [Sulfitobacter sp. Ks18]
MQTATQLGGLRAQINALSPVRPVGRVARVKAGVIEVLGLAATARIGDWITIQREGQPPLASEVVQLKGDVIIALPEGVPDGVALQDRAVLSHENAVAPADAWMGRVIDPSGQPLDGIPLLRGSTPRPLRCPPPAPAKRRALGARLNTGMAVTNTLLPLVRGQRIGLFAGSGVGKSSLLGQLARNVEAEVVVIALIGERGRELRHFIDEVIGEEGLKRTVIVAATSDQSALKRRRCAWTAMAVAEHFRDQGKQVLLLADSITRFAEAHREVAVAAGEAPVLRGYPPSTAHMIMSLCERAGSGAGEQGDITALFSVLVAGSDMDEPIADILRGVLDGHIVLDRTIAERGRYPAIDVLRSVSRSLPNAASVSENALLHQTRRLLGLYDRNAVIIRAGLYVQGSDPELDQAIALWTDLDDFLGQDAPQDCTHSFQQLNLILRRAKASQNRPQTTTLDTGAS